jgi:transcriptional antiterminator RfaH
MKKTWYVVYTHANSEAKARSHLLRQGFTTMLPTYRCWRSHARKREVVERPLFPRYLFVALDMLEQRWRPILSTVGVCDLVRHGNAPTPLPTGLAEELGTRAAHGDFDRLSPLDGLRDGDVVLIMEGPFADLVGRFAGLADKDRVFVLLDLLGRQVRATLSHAAVSPA